MNEISRLASVNVRTTYAEVDMPHPLVDRILRKCDRPSRLPTYLPTSLLNYLSIKVHNFTKHKTEIVFRMRPSELLHHIDISVSGFQRCEIRCDINLCLHDRADTFLYVSSRLTDYTRPEAEYLLCRANG
jgi:hypothetical protein